MSSTILWTTYGSVKKQRAASRQATQAMPPTHPMKLIGCETANWHRHPQPQQQRDGHRSPGLHVGEYCRRRNDTGPDITGQICAAECTSGSKGWAHLNHNVVVQGNIAHPLNGHRYQRAYPHTHGACNHHANRRECSLGHRDAVCHVSAANCPGRCWR